VHSAEMKLYIYQGLDNERVPKDVTHVIVDNSVAIIKAKAFMNCTQLVSVIMGDHVKIIEMFAFFGCCVLRFIRFSKTLAYIGNLGFWGCESLEVLFLPSTVRSIEYEAFVHCQSLRLLILPNGIDLSNVGFRIIGGTAIEKIARAAGAEYEWKRGALTDESNRRVNEWLIHHMDESPFHKLCYTSSITTKQISNYLDEDVSNSALQSDPVRGMTPLHLLTINPDAPADSIAALFESNRDAVFCLDNDLNTPLDYARDYNAAGLLAMIASLCIH